MRAVQQSKIYDAGMVTRIHKRVRRRLYAKEWRDHFDVSAESLAERLNVTRQTVHRWEREPNRFTPDKQEAYAFALGIEPEALWRHPDAPSVDALLARSDDSLKRRAAELVAILLKTGT